MTGSPAAAPEASGTQRTLGYTLDLGSGDGRARCRMTVADAHTNRHGVLHGGMATALLDSAMGATGSLSVDASGRAPFLTVSLNVQFVAPARPGDALCATGWITGGGRSMVFIGGELMTDGGVLIATAQGVFKRVSGEAR